MRRDKPPYYKVRRGRGFFELGRARAARVGLPASIPCGQDGKKAKASAWRLYNEWLEKSGKKEPTTDFIGELGKYPAGSLGSWMFHYTHTAAWKKKASTTRTEWENCWKYIAPEFGARPIRSIAPAEFAEFQDRLEETKGEYVRWRVVKIARALFKAAIDNHILTASPAKSLTNPMPKGRHQIWRAAEIAKLIETAEQIDKPAMALAIKIAWECAYQPVDVRKLTLEKRHRNATGAWFETTRSKTGAPIISAITETLCKEIDAYVDSLGIVIPDDQPFLRTSRDGHIYRKARFGSDFDLVRKKAFGENETRRFQDIRRSANIEAEIGGASPQERAALLANNLDQDKSLDATYTPSTVERSREIAKKREVGRRHLAVQSVNTSGGSVN